MNRYITADDESDILKYLKEWETGRYGKKLTWDILKKAFGFSRQALSGNTNVKKGFDDAKTKLKEANTEIDALTDISKDNRQLKKDLSKAHEKIHEYEQKYIRWQVNAMAKGVSVDALNKPVDPSIKEELRKRTLED
jgi:hypothetical protein